MSDQQNPQQHQNPLMQLPQQTSDSNSMFPLPQQTSDTNGMFSLGISNTTQQGKKDVPQTAAQMAEKRSQQLLGDGNLVESSQRKRVDFAESLRRKKQDQEKQEKRKRMTNPATTNVPIPQPTNTPQQFSLPQPPPQVVHSFGHQTMSSSLSIDQLLTQAQQSPIEQVIQEGNNIVVNLNDFDKVEGLIWSDIPIIQILAVTFLRKLLSFESDPPIQKTVDRNLIPRLFSLARSIESPKLQFEAIWCLTNIASSESSFVLKLIEHQAIKILIEIMSTETHIEVKEQTIWCLGNIAGDNVRFREALLDQNVLPKICDLIDIANANSSFVRNSIWTLSNLCKGKPSPDFQRVERAIPTFARVLAETDQTEILNDICWTLSYITDEGGDERILVFLQSKIVPRLCTLLHHAEIIIAVPALRTLGNILTARDEYAQEAINCNVLEAFTELLDHPKKAIRKEICWSISNVTAGNPSQIQHCIDIGLIDKIIRLMETATLDIKQEAVWCLSNSTSQATPAQIQTLVNKGILKAINQVLTSRDPRTLIVALEGINFILKNGRDHLVNDIGVNPMVVEAEQSGVVDSIEQLQMMENFKVYEKAVEILENYFQLEEQKDIMEMLMQQPGSTDCSTPVNNQFSF